MHEVPFMGSYMTPCSYRVRVDTTRPSLVFRDTVEVARSRHRVNVRWVTPLDVETASTSYCCSNASRPSHSRTPRPSRIGTCTTCRWSTRPAAMNCARRGRAPADADVLTGGSVPRHLECIRWRGVEEVERRTTLHLQRRALTMGQDVRRRVERRVVAPPPAPLRIVLPARRAELARAHDLRTDPGSVLDGHRVIDPLGTARLAEEFTAAEPGGEHPLVEPMPGMAERRVEGLPLAGGEPVERDREVVDADA